MSVTRITLSRKSFIKPSVSSVKPEFLTCTDTDLIM